MYFPRLQDPACDLDQWWEEEPLERAASRTINLLHAATAGAGAGAGAAPPPAHYLTAPGLCYVFPLLKKGIYVLFGLIMYTLRHV